SAAARAWPDDLSRPSAPKGAARCRDSADEGTSDLRTVAHRRRGGPPWREYSTRPRRRAQWPYAGPPAWSAADRRRRIRPPSRVRHRPRNPRRGLRRTRTGDGLWHGDRSSPYLSSATDGEAPRRPEPHQ